MNIRPLSKELQEKAIAELNEDPSRIQEDLNYIKEWLAKQKYIRARTDDQWLISFLRGCKFSLERTKEKLDMFYTVRTIIPEFFHNRDPFGADVQEVLKLGMCLPLRKYAGPDTQRVLLIRNAGYDPNIISTQAMFKTNMMISDILINEDDQMTVAGLTMLQDLEGSNMAQTLHMTPLIVKKAMTCFQEAYPTRPKGMHFYNIPSFFETVFNTFKPFMKAKMLKRVVFHNTDNKEELFKIVPKSILPAEYGGDGEPLDELIDYWKQKVESYKDWFAEDEKKYGTDESKRPGKPKSSSDMFGIEGSFRKLTVD